MVTLFGNSPALNKAWYIAGALLGGYPLAQGSVANAESELYHTSHDAWETEAPLYAMTTYENTYRTRAEQGEIQLGTWVNMIRTPAVLTLLRLER